MTFYLDASVILRRLLGDGAPLGRWLEWELALASDIALVEVWRTLHRLRLLGNLSPRQFARAGHEFGELEFAISWVPVSSQVVALAAASLPTPVKTLDAIHLASAVRSQVTLGRDIIFATHDRQLGAAAAALDFDVEGM